MDRTLFCPLCENQVALSESGLVVCLIFSPYNLKASPTPNEVVLWAGDKLTIYS